MNQFRQLELDLEITELCNFGCVHCYLERKTKPLFNLELARTLSELAYDNGFYKIALTGGEPTLHPQFEEIYKVFRLKGYVVSVYTNASFPQESVIELFQNLAPHQIEVTLYGMSEETYSKTTKRENMYKTVMTNIRKLHQAGIHLCLKYNLLTFTKDDFEQFLYLVNEEFQCEYTVNAQIVPMLNGDLAPTKYRLTPEEITEIGKKHNIPFSPQEDLNNRCDAGETLYVTSQGDVRGCTILTTKEDSLFVKNPEDVIKGVQAYFKQFHKKRTDNFCPAWVELENSTSVSQFISGVK